MSFQAFRRPIELPRTIAANGVTDPLDTPTPIGHDSLGRPRRQGRHHGDILRQFLRQPMPR